MEGVAEEYSGTPLLLRWVEGVAKEYGGTPLGLPAGYGGEVVSEPAPSLTHRAVHPSALLQPGHQQIC